jgi:two-component sensor histidine kinase
MLRAMLDMADRHDVALSLDVAPLPLPAERKMTLALFALEATTNALKHAFAGRAGRLHVELARLDAERAIIRVRDDGPGWAEGRLEPRRDQAERSLGLRVLGSFANAVQGELQLANDGGAVVGIVFPLASGSAASPAAVMGA